MARKLDKSLGEVTRWDGISVYPEGLTVVPGDNGRKFPPSRADLDALKNDIYTNGQDQPVVTRGTGDGKLILVAGFNRHTAITEINADILAGKLEGPKRKIKVVTVTANREESFLRNIQENDKRSPLTAVDYAFNIRKLTEEPYSWDIPKVAAFFGRSPAWVNQHIKLTLLSLDIQRLIHDGDLATNVGMALADLPEDEQQAALAAGVEGEEEESGKRVDSGKVKDSIRKAKQKKGKKSGQLSVKQIVTFFEQIGPANGKQVNRLAGNTLEWIKGKLDDEHFLGRLENLNKD